MRRADSRAICTAGSSSDTSTPIMAITTSSSTSVNAREQRPEFIGNSLRKEASHCASRRSNRRKQPHMPLLGAPDCWRNGKPDDQPRSARMAICNALR